MIHKEQPMANAQKAETDREKPRPGPETYMPLLGTWLNAANNPFGGFSSVIPPDILAQLEALSKINEPLAAPLTPQDLNGFIEGVKAYQKHPASRDDRSEVPVIWEQGSTRLLDYNAKAASKAPIVLVIPSLINRFAILDLEPEHSLLRLMAAQGLRPLVVDWNEPGAEEKEFTLSDYMTKRLFPILDFIKANQQPVHVFGYCMGGLLALAVALLKREDVRSLALMATPWNFAANDTGKSFMALADRLEPQLKQFGFLPVDVIQAMFASFQPLRVVRKFARLATLDMMSDEARRFVLTEDWLNDGVPLAAPVARECLREWYGENRPGRMQWRIADQAIDPRALGLPAYVLIAGKDKLVAPESARPLSRLIRGAFLHEPMFGHIGLLAGAEAPRNVWLPLIRWLLAH